VRCARHPHQVVVDGLWAHAAAHRNGVHSSRGGALRRARVQLHAEVARDVQAVVHRRRALRVRCCARCCAVASGPALCDSPCAARVRVLLAAPGAGRVRAGVLPPPHDAARDHRSALYVSRTAGDSCRGSRCCVCCVLSAAWCGAAGCVAWRRRARARSLYVREGTSLSLSPRAPFTLSFLRSVFPPGVWARVGDGGGVAAVEGGSRAFCRPSPRAALCTCSRLARDMLLALSM
jgi:hypothetical protein